MPDRDDASTRKDERLARAASATAGVTPAEGFTDAVVRAVSSDPLVRAVRATADLEPDGALADAVMRRVARPRPPRVAASRLADGLVRSGPAAIVFATVAAAACALFWLDVQREVDAAVVATVDAVEISE